MDIYRNFSLEEEMDRLVELLDHLSYEEVSSNTRLVRVLDECEAKFTKFLANPEAHANKRFESVHQQVVAAISVREIRTNLQLRKHIWSRRVISGGTENEVH